MIISGFLMTVTANFFFGPNLDEHKWNFPTTCKPLTTMDQNLVAPLNLKKKIHLINLESRNLHLGILV